MVPEVDTSDLLAADFSPFLADVKQCVETLGEKYATPVIRTAQELVRKAPSSLPTAFEIRGSAIGVTEVQVHEAALVFEDSNLLPLFQAAYNRRTFMAIKLRTNAAIHPVNPPSPMLRKSVIRTVDNGRVGKTSCDSVLDTKGGIVSSFYRSCFRHVAVSWPRLP
jgi:hypothetical protein